MIEWCDGGDDPKQGLAQRDDLAPLALMGDVAGEHLPVIAQDFGGAEVQHVGHAADFVPRILFAKVRFEDDEVRGLFGAIAQQGGGAAEDA